ncbi:MAG: hypothetical protein M3O31_15140 [Acidobacteriota bacterium]|nr:hypothetical protein [Acidobacteriota bacterium]
MSMLQLWFVANTVLWTFSIEVGGLKLGLNVVVLMIAGAVWLGRIRKVSFFSTKATAALFVYMALSWMLALSGPCNNQFLKAALTAPILPFLVLVGLELGRRSSDNDWIKLEKTAAWVLLAAFLGLAVEVIVPQFLPANQGFRAQGKYSGLFREPSHVAFSLFPCIAVLLVAGNKRARQIGWAGLFGLMVLSRTSTLIALIGVWLLYRLLVQKKNGRAALLLVGTASLIAIASAINYETLVAPTLERVVGIEASDQTDNISSLVYVQGWEDTWANLIRTHGRGLGVNMMGCSPLPDVPARGLLSTFFAAGLNAEDGSFTFAKIVSETGLVGIAFYGVIIWAWIRQEKRLIREGHSIHRSAVAARSAIIFCFVASSFIRGLGYFSGGLLLWVVAFSERPVIKPSQPSDLNSKGKIHSARHVS